MTTFEETLNSLLIVCWNLQKTLLLKTVTCLCSALWWPLHEGNSKIKGNDFFSQTPNKSGHSFATVNSNSLNINRFVWKKNLSYFCWDFKACSTYHCLLGCCRRHFHRFLCCNVRFVRVLFLNCYWCLRWCRAFVHRRNCCCYPANSIPTVLIRHFRFHSHLEFRWEKRWCVQRVCIWM